MISMLQFRLTRLASVATLIFLAQSSYALDITEIFSFSCSHCYNVENQVEQIAKQRDIRVIPVPLYNPNNINETAVTSSLFAAKKMGKEWAFRRAYFNAVFVNGYPVYANQTLKYALSQAGLDNKQFYQMASSKQVINDMVQSANLAIKYNVSGTPTFIVNERLYEGEDGLKKIFTE